MQDDVSKQSKSLEDAFFAQKDARVLERMRSRASREECRKALRDATGIDDAAFLDRMIDQGMAPETVMAIRLVPLVCVAWADGEMDDREREAILKASKQKGTRIDETARELLEGWLDRSPGPQMMALWKGYVRRLQEQLNDDQKRQMRDNLVGLAREVAQSAGGFLGLGSKISAAEQTVLDDLESVFG